VALYAALAVAAPTHAGDKEAQPTTMSLHAAAKARNINVSGLLLPAQPGGPVKITLRRSKQGGVPPKPVKSTQTTINLEGRFATTMRRRPKGNCEILAKWAGDADSLPASALVGFRC
jgi:hypothetical protein